MSLRFREWLAKHSEDDQSIDFWRVVQRKRRNNFNIRNIFNIRVQGTIYTALLFFLEHFDGNVPFLESTIKKITKIENEYLLYSEYSEYSLFSEYSRLVDNIAYGYDDNNISLCLVDIASGDIQTNKRVMIQ
jgi:hypothetical protein